MVIKNISHVCPRDLGLVLTFLVISPVSLPIPLLISESLVELLEILELFVLLVSGLVFEHTSHSGDVLGLHSVVMLFVVFSLKPLLLFSHLLFAPLLLERSVLVLSFKEA